MIQKYITHKRNENLILFFAGWGMDTLSYPMIPILAILWSATTTGQWISIFQP